MSSKNNIQEIPWHRKCYDIWCDPSGNTALFKIVLSFAFGLILASFSYGFIFFLAWYIVFEIFLIYWYHYKLTVEYMLIRFGIFCAGLIGFLIGRYHEGDNDPTLWIYE